MSLASDKTSESDLYDYGIFRIRTQIAVVIGITQSEESFTEQEDGTRRRVAKRKCLMRAGNKIHFCGAPKPARKGAVRYSGRFAEMTKLE